MPEDFSVVVICSIHKKNYRGISLLNTTYKIPAKIISKRLKPYIEESLGEYQNGFRRDNTTTDNIFVISNILEKCYEYYLTMHQLLVDFTQAYDSVKWKAVLI
jgi:hypothetical protein